MMFIYQKKENKHRKEEKKIDENKIFVCHLDVFFSQEEEKKILRSRINHHHQVRKSNK
jgi:hypothetical protein